MILVDTSIWIDFWRGERRVAKLGALLEDAQVLLHPWVLGELALGQLGARRRAILEDLALLPTAPVVADAEVLGMVDELALGGSGLGWVDVQLLASGKLAAAELWSGDRRLARAWSSLR